MILTFFCICIIANGKTSTDASPSRCRQSRICALHRDELLLGLAMYVVLCSSTTWSLTYIPQTNSRRHAECVRFTIPVTAQTNI